MQQEDIKKGKTKSAIIFTKTTENMEVEVDSKTLMKLASQNLGEYPLEKVV